MGTSLFFKLCHFYQQVYHPEKSFIKMLHLRRFDLFCRDVFCSMFDSFESIQKVSELKCSRENMVAAAVVAVAGEAAEAAITAARER